MFEDVDGPEQKTLLRLLIIAGIGIPILIEVVTFGSMMGHHLMGDTGDEAVPETPTAAEAGAGVGDPILESAAVSARIDAGSVVTADEGWRFTLTVNVTNTGSDPAAVRLDSVTTRNGETIEGAATTGQLSVEETDDVTKSWLLPPGERPDTVSVTVLTYPDGGSVQSTQYTVALGDIPVSNR
ncbi:hypothetical protein SAMN05443574_10977 [Haloarcula vallismortis]|uniref:DUF4352 domain-containing protein n=2 Tax=Haloarcula vallismortis TaxID=28442 RepID=M0JRR4_HALVA|nr:hypothetical protein [Haloarcula vallismortis]EMA10360.1 hypothetical protein C437_03616 [Haloarcula vallismortis ATCC 29715]SDW91010.1 hypothetical protein SAMN05443574_10977 [Haloarcula vallismortis]